MGRRAGLDMSMRGSSPVTPEHKERGCPDTTQGHKQALCIWPDMALAGRCMFPHTPSPESWHSDQGMGGNAIVWWLATACQPKRRPVCLWTCAPDIVVHRHSMQDRLRNPKP